MAERTLYIVRGIPGSGKTTWVKKHNVNAAFSSDDFMVDVIDDREVYFFRPEKLAMTHNTCLNRAVMAMHQGIPIVAVHNTFIKLWEFIHYISIAEALGYTPIIVEMRVMTVKGVYMCVEKNEHNVPFGKVADMYMNFQKYIGPHQVITEIFERRPL